MDRSSFLQIQQCGSEFCISFAGNSRVVRHEQRQKEYNDLMRDMSERSEPLLVFDFVGCEMIDSVTVGMLVELTLSTRRNGGDAAVVRTGAEIRRLLEDLMLLQPRGKTAVWQSFLDPETAIDWLRNRPENAVAASVTCD